jgi:hypothetical protein
MACDHGVAPFQGDPAGAVKSIPANPPGPIITVLARLVTTSGSLAAALDPAATQDREAGSWTDCAD